MKKTLTLILCILMLVPVIAACGNAGNTGASTTAAATTAASGEVTTDSLYDANGYLKDSLPADLDFGGTTVTTLMWSDHTMLEFYVEETSGNNIESAIYKRNANVEDRLNVKLAYAESKGASGSETVYVNAVTADRDSGDAQYDIYASYSRVLPMLTLKGYCVDLLSTKYFDIDKPWWPEALTDECTINNKLYFASGDISTNLLWMMIGTFYNRNIYASYTGDSRYSKTPEEYVKDNTWTMDTLFSMTKETYIDTDGSNSKTVGDTFGMVIYEINIDAFQTAAGITSIEKNNEGKIEISSDFNGQRAADVCQLVGDYLASTGVMYQSKTSIRDIFFGERATFIMDRCFIVAGKDNASDKEKIEFSFGIVPQPKYTSDQENYSTNIGHPFTMYGIAASSKNVDAASATLECLASESYRLVTPEVFESTMKVRYADGSEVAEMYDILRNGVSFDIGRLYAPTFSNYTTNAFRTNAKDSPASYLSNLQKYVKIIKKGIETVNEAYQ